MSKFLMTVIYLLVTFLLAEVLFPDYDYWLFIYGVFVGMIYTLIVDLED